MIALAVCVWGYCAVQVADAPGAIPDDCAGEWISGWVDGKTIVMSARPAAAVVATGRSARVVRRPAARAVFLIRIRSEPAWDCGYTIMCVYQVVAVPIAVYDEAMIGDRWYGRSVLSHPVRL